jgi:hypothetical protein
LFPDVVGSVNYVDVVVGLLVDAAAGVKVGVVSNTARDCAVGVHAVDKVVTIVGVGRAYWGQRWKRWLFGHGRWCFDWWKMLVLHGNREDSRRTLDWTEDHHVVVLHKVTRETPVDEPALTSSGEGAGIEDVGFVSLREAEDADVELKVIVAFTLEVDGGILVVVDDDILVGEL